MVGAAEAGDFSTFSSEEAVQVNLMIEGLRDSPESPIKPPEGGSREAACYGFFLSALPDLFHKKGEYERFWRAPFEAILQSFNHFEKGIILVEEFEEERLSVVVDSTRPAREAIDRYCQGDLYLVVQDRETDTGGFFYDLEYRYYAWADTVTRPKINPIPMGDLAVELNRREKNRQGRWADGVLPGQPLTQVLRFAGPDGMALASALHPEEVVQFLRTHLDAHKGMQM
jgi:hypothetical protein